MRGTSTSKPKTGRCFVIPVRYRLLLATLGIKRANSVDLLILGWRVDRVHPSLVLLSDEQFMKF